MLFHATALDATSNVKRRAKISRTDQHQRCSFRRSGLAISPNLIIKGLEFHETDLCAAFDPSCESKKVTLNTKNFIPSIKSYIQTAAKNRNKESISILLSSVFRNTFFDLNKTIVAYLTPVVIL